MYESIKEIIEFLAFLGAAVFFGFKFMSGFFVYNLSISLKCDRSAVKGSEKDVLIVTVELDKGDMSSIALHDIQALISYGQIAESIPFHGIQRCSNTPEKIGEFSRNVANIKQKSKSSPLLNLSPGEKASFSCYTKVPAKETITVELVVLGKRSYVGKDVGQWRSSIISPPIAQYDPGSQISIATYPPDDKSRVVKKPAP